jgi:hypothetical protein
LIRQNYLASCRCDFKQRQTLGDGPDPDCLSGSYYEVAPRLARPQLQKIRVIDEYLWGIGRVRAVLKNKITAVQDQGLILVVEKDRR